MNTYKAGTNSSDLYREGKGRRSNISVEWSTVLSETCDRHVTEVIPQQFKPVTEGETVDTGRMGDFSA